MSFLSAEQVLCCIAPGERVTLLLRHAERRHITAQDADHGAHVPLTEKGGKQAFAAGKELSVLNGPYFFGSSPVFRCRQTAAFIAEACGASEYAVPEKVAPLQPLAEFYVSDFEEYMRHLREGFYPAICKWVADGRLSGFTPVKEGSEALLKFVLEHSTGNFNVFCTHDAWVVPFLSHFTDVSFNPNRWLNFLSGAAILYKPENPLETAKILPIKFIRDGYLVFSDWEANNKTQV